AWVLAPPVLALAALGVPRGRSPERAARHLVAFGAGFMAVAAASYVRSLLALGPERFAREVLLVGAGVAGVYVLPFPRPAVLPRRVATTLVLGLPLLAAALRFVPTVGLLARLATGRVEEVAIGPVRLVAAADGVAPLRALADVVEQVAGRTAADDRILTFPACGVVPFFAGRLPIGRHDYFYPGRPDRAEMAAVLDELGPLLPDLAVTCTPAS